MSEANVVREYAVMQVDDKGRVRVQTRLWSYGQAMHTATAYATDHPELNVFLASRVVIQEDWQEVDFEAEEYRLAQGKEPAT